MGKNSAITTDILKEKMIDALEASFGNVSQAAKSAGIDPRTHYRWMKEDPNYANHAENMKDICFRKIKDNLLEKALMMIDKGNPAILSKMLGIYFKKLPDEMSRLSRHNDVPLRVGINYVKSPWKKPENWEEESGM
jgi:hypothetical protein